jgi:hypothetical protein
MVPLKNSVVKKFLVWDFIIYSLYTYRVAVSIRSVQSEI